MWKHSLLSVEERFQLNSKYFSHLVVEGFCRSQLKSESFRSGAVITKSASCIFTVAVICRVHFNRVWCEEFFAKWKLFCLSGSGFLDSRTIPLYLCSLFSVLPNPVQIAVCFLPIVGVGGVLVELVQRVRHFKRIGEMFSVWVVSTFVDEGGHLT